MKKSVFALTALVTLGFAGLAFAGDAPKGTSRRLPHRP